MGNKQRREHHGIENEEIEKQHLLPKTSDLIMP
jgi:hypothetical protein